MSDPVSRPHSLGDASDDDVNEVVRALYESEGPAILSLGHRYFGGRRDLAEELVAETFARVLIGIRQFSGRSTYRTWIFRIAMNVAARWLRDMKRRPTSSLDAAVVASAAAPETPDPLVESERNADVNRAVQALSPDHRMVLALVVQEGLTQVEVADLLGVAPGTVWSRYARARIAPSTSTAIRRRRRSPFRATATSARGRRGSAPRPASLSSR